MVNVRTGVIVVAVGVLACSCYSQVRGLADSTKAGPFKNVVGTAGYSGWRGGIGITFCHLGETIADVTELGYEMCWGAERPQICEALDLTLFQYWNGIIEVNLKDKRYDFSAMADKEEAARLAFDAWAEINYGEKGLSKYATVQYAPKGYYGNVLGRMDLASENPLTTAVVNKRVKRLLDEKIKRGGIGIDNFPVMAGPFITLLKNKLNPHGLGIAVNGDPREMVKNPSVCDIDVAGVEGFRCSVEEARAIRAKGFDGIFCEFVMQHMSASELEAYLKSKLFYGIVFFGYTDGGVACSSHYTFYTSRPDVYNHHRWVFRKYVPISRALFNAGGQEAPCAELGITVKGVAAKRGKEDEPQDKPVVRTDGSGGVFEQGQFTAGMQKITGMKPDTPGGIFRFGDKIDAGIYFFVSSPGSETVTCDVRKLQIGSDTKVFDEINERLIDGKLTDSALRFNTAPGPGVVQLGTRAVIARNLVTRMESLFEQEDKQKKLEEGLKFDPLRKAWPSFCYGWSPDVSTGRSGRASMKVWGDEHFTANKKYRYHRRMGGAQFISLDQKAASPITVSAWSKADAVPSSPFTAIVNRREHFMCRETNTYVMHVYLDYQDGQWPETHTVAFSAGTHDWEQRTIAVNPKKPVKTAMVLLEFQQQSGTAWFDDISLVQGKDGVNLLAYAGFEKGDAGQAKAVGVRKEYETGLNALRTLIGNAGRRAPVTEMEINAIRKETGIIEERLLKSEAASLFGRELRDMKNVRHLADVCLNVL